MRAAYRLALAAVAYAALAVAAPPAAAQESAPAAKVDAGQASAEQTAELPPRTVLLFMDFAKGSRFTPAQRQLLFESLAQRLDQASPDVLVSQYPQSQLPAGADPSQISIDRGIDAWIVVTASGDMAKARFAVKAFDLQRDRAFFELTIETAVDSRFRNAFYSMWLDAEKQVAATIRKNRQINTIDFRGPLGAKIDVGAEPSQTIADPAVAASFGLAAPANYDWHAYLPGHHYLDGKTFLRENQSVALDFKPTFPVHAEIGLDWLSFPTLRCLVALRPDALDLDIGFVFYNLGIVLASPQDGNGGLFHDYGLVNFLLGVRYYPLEHRYALRPWFGAGVQARFQTSPEFDIDKLNPVGFYLQCGASLDLDQNLALFVELTPRVTYSRSTDAALSALAQAGSQNTGLGQVWPVGDFLVEPWHLLFGVRIQP